MLDPLYSLLLTYYSKAPVAKNSGRCFFALRKKSGALRPIVTGYLWRRLPSMSASALAIPRLTPYLSPQQIGVGTPGETEAAVHATRRFLQTMYQYTVLVKLNILNTLHVKLNILNTLHRSHDVCGQCFNINIAPHCHPTYHIVISITIWHLHHAVRGLNRKIRWALFCLPHATDSPQTVLIRIFGYLDDISLGGSTSVVAED